MKKKKLTYQITYFPKNDNNVSLLIPVVTVNVSTKNDYVKHRLLTNNKDVGISNKKDVGMTKKLDVDIPQNKDVDIPAKNINQPSVPVNVPPKILSKKSFNSETVENHILSNNKDVGIQKKRCRHTKTIDVEIAQNKDVDIPFKNNNQYSVPVNVSPKTIS